MSDVGGLEVELWKILNRKISGMNRITSGKLFTVITMDYPSSTFSSKLEKQIQKIRGRKLSHFGKGGFKLIYMISMELLDIFDHDSIFKFYDKNGAAIKKTKKNINLMNGIQTNKFYELSYRYRYVL